MVHPSIDDTTASEPSRARQKKLENLTKPSFCATEEIPVNGR
jgi:hypothetical protein